MTTINTEPTADEGVVELTGEEARQFFDEKARYYLGMSGEEFIRKYKAGYWPDPDDDTNVMFLAMLMPFGE